MMVVEYGEGSKGVDERTSCRVWPVMVNAERCRRASMSVDYCH